MAGAQSSPADDPQVPIPPPQPTPEGALDEVWRALRDFYPMLEYAGCVGDAWVEELRPRVQQAPTLHEALPLIEELVLRLADYHTRLVWPDKPRLLSPPVALAWVEGVLAVADAETGSGLRPGDVVLGIDGAPASEAMNAAWARSHGATQEARRREACARLLLGSPGTTLRLTTAAGEVTLVREAPTARSSRPDVLSFTTLEGGDTGLLRIRAWGGGLPAEAFVARMDALLEEARSLPHLVIDVRGNGGGLDALADACTGRFIASRVVSSISFHRQPGTATFERTVEYCPPRGPWRYGGRVAVLQDAGCCSACEHFLSGMDAAGTACLVGLPSTGACGWSRRIDLTCGATLYCAMTFPLHGGVPSPLHGIEPHLRVPPTLADLRAQRDAPLAAALAWLQSGAGLPEARNTPWTG